MVLRQRRFLRRRRIRWRRKKKRGQGGGPWVRLIDWWNRKQFYTYHKDEVITEATTTKPVVCHTPSTEAKNLEEEDEWNNESESGDDEEFGIETCDDGSLEVELGPADIETLETIDEETSLDDSPRLGSKPKINVLLPPKPKPKLATTLPTAPTALYRSNGTVDSLSGSLESMDSLVESQWDPEDDASNTTPLVTNIHQSSEAFFVEHVRFLQIQTQPRKVELVYNKQDPEREETITEPSK